MAERRRRRQSPHLSPLLGLAEPLASHALTSQELRRFLLCITSTKAMPPHSESRDGHSSDHAPWLGLLWPWLMASNYFPEVRRPGN